MAKKVTMLALGVRLIIAFAVAIMISSWVGLLEPSIHPRAAGHTLPHRRKVLAQGRASRIRQGIASFLKKEKKKKGKRRRKNCVGQVRLNARKQVESPICSFFVIVIILRFVVKRQWTKTGGPSLLSGVGSGEQKPSG